MATTNTPPANAKQVFFDSNDEEMEQYEELVNSERRYSPIGQLTQPMPPLKVHYDNKLHTNYESSSSSSTRARLANDRVEMWYNQDLFEGILRVRRILAGFPPNGTQTTWVHAMKSQESQEFPRRTQAQEEVVFVGDEHSMQGRFNNNVHDFVLRALHQAMHDESQGNHFRSIAIGDSHTFNHNLQPLVDMESRKDPDFVICKLSNQIAVCSGELKTPWTLWMAPLLHSAREDRPERLCAKLGT